jgi:hypothetical protein
MKKPAPAKKLKEPFSVRLDADERKALEAAGAAEDRPAAYVARRVLTDWLKAKGFLK